jgi:hypothetical protein
MLEVSSSFLKNILERKKARKMTISGNTANASNVT